jgi:hypothetical protein
MGEHSPFPSMASFINAAMSVEGILSRREDGIELGFLDI